MASKKKIKVHVAQLIPVDKLRWLEGNSQKQSKQQFAELKKNILEEGFDETLIVKTRIDGAYDVISGNHRGQAGVELGIEALPCVIRDDWDDIKAQFQSVRRNYVRGVIDKNLFTAQVNTLKDKHSVSYTDILEGIGFADMDDFAALYKDEKEKQEKAHEAMAEDASSDASAIKMMDDLGMIISSLIQKYGDTIPNSFIIIPVGGKNHLYIASNASLKKSLHSIATACIDQGMDINVALAGLLSIGLSQTNFLNKDGKAEVKDAANVSGESDIEVL